MSATTETAKRTILPPANTDALLDLSRFLDQHAEPAALLGPDGEQIPLPIEVYQILVRVVDAMSKQRGVTIAPVEQKLTTQQAADLLGMSRPTLTKILDQGEIPFEKLPGSRHRRLLLADVLDYQSRRAERRNQALTELVRDAEEQGLYDITNEQYQDALKHVRAARRRK